MWAKEKEKMHRHCYGSYKEGKLKTLCGLEGEAPLSYVEVKVEKCMKCKELLGRGR